MVQDKEASLPAWQKSKIEVKHRKVFLNEVAVEKQLLPPQPIELMVDRAERDKMDKIKFVTSDTQSFQGSEFFGFAFKTGQLNEVKRVYRKVRCLQPSADHIDAAYNLKTLSGYQDDG